VTRPPRQSSSPLSTLSPPGNRKISSEGHFEKFWILKFGIAAKAHFKKWAILLWRIHGIDWLKIGKSSFEGVLFLFLCGFNSI
jgi:hypothetical protein